MRDFEERKAEIFRRSDERIQKRKRNRNRLLACCIPLCICMVTCAYICVAGLPSSDVMPGALEMCGEAHGMASCSYVSVEIQQHKKGNEAHLEITQPDDVASIADTIYLLFHSFHLEGEGCLGEAVANPDEIFENNSEEIYTITLTASDGSRMDYVLAGNYLRDETTKQYLNLTDEQLSELKSILKQSE